MTEKEVADKVIDVYKESGFSIDEIISSLKHLLATAQFSQLNLED